MVFKLLQQGFDLMGFIKREVVTVDAVVVDGDKGDFTVGGGEGDG